MNRCRSHSHSRCCYCCHYCCYCWPLGSVVPCALYPLSCYCCPFCPCPSCPLSSSPLAHASCLWSLSWTFSPSFLSCPSFSSSVRMLEERQAIRAVVKHKQVHINSGNYPHSKVPTVAFTDRLFLAAHSAALTDTCLLLCASHTTAGSNQTMMTQSRPHPPSTTNPPFPSCSSSGGPVLP